MWENFYLGGEEYIITFRNGQSHIYSVYDMETKDVPKPVFSGHYEKCLDKKQLMETEYLESLYF